MQILTWVLSGCHGGVPEATSLFLIMLHKKAIWGLCVTKSGQNCAVFVNLIRAFFKIPVSIYTSDLDQTSYSYRNLCPFRTNCLFRITCFCYLLYAYRFTQTNHLLSSKAATLCPTLAQFFLEWNCTKCRLYSAGLFVISPGQVHWVSYTHSLLGYCRQERQKFMLQIGGSCFSLG